MNGNKAEHIKEAAAVVSQYCDIIAVRAFPTLTDKAKDESEQVMNAFKKYASVPIVNMESATGHPLQGLTDALTIAEHAKVDRPKVVLSWAPHIKALPHAVANSFTQAMQCTYFEGEFRAVLFLIVVHRWVGDICMSMMVR